jgi:hypothetical protein
VSVLLRVLRKLLLVESDLLQQVLVGVQVNGVLCVQVCPSLI